MMILKNSGKCKISRRQGTGERIGAMPSPFTRKREKPDRHRVSLLKSQMGIYPAFSPHSCAQLLYTAQPNSCPHVVSLHVTNLTNAP